MVKNILISIGALTLLWCKFIPLTLTILIILIVTMINTSHEIINDPKGKNEKLKYFFAILIYSLVFMLIYLYMKVNNFEMGEFTF